MGGTAKASAKGAGAGLMAADPAGPGPAPDPTLPAPPPSPRQRLASLRHNRGLELGALALMLTTALTSGMGVIFWGVAPHLYSANDLGRASAALSTATLLSALAGVNMGNLYARYLPVVTIHRRRMVLAGYGAVSLLAILLGVGFLFLGPATHVLSGSVERTLFPLSVAVLTLFSVQDAVLVGLRKTAWVPIENAVFAAAKLVLLFLLARGLPQQGIAAAWMAPAVLAVLVVSGIVMVRGLRPIRDDRPVVLPPGRRALGSVAGAEYVIGAVTIAVPQSLPLLVISRLGAEQNAYFYFPWMFASMLGVLVWQAAGPLLVEASSHREQAPVLVRRALRLALMVGGAGTAATLLLGPFILSLSGSQYATAGTTLMRVAVLAIPFVAINMAWATATRIVGRMRRLVVVELASGSAVLALSWALLPHLGIVAVGVAYASTQAVLSVAVSPWLYRFLRTQPGTGTTSR